MNVGMLMFFQISVLGSFGYIPRSGIAGQKADPFLIFWVISILLSTVAAQSAFPPIVSKCSPFSTSYYYFLMFYCFCYYSCPKFSPLCLSQPAPTSMVNPHTIVHVHGSFLFVLWLIPSRSFSHTPPPSSHLTAVSLFHESVPLVLFCFYFPFAFGRFFQTQCYILWLSLSARVCNTQMFLS